MELTVMALGTIVDRHLSPVKNVGELKETILAAETGKYHSFTESISINLGRSQSRPDVKAKCQMAYSKVQFQDYDGKSHLFNFALCDSIVKNSQINRKNTKVKIGKGAHQVAINFDNQYFESILTIYREEIRKLGLNKVQAAKFIVSSIQSIPYTLLHVHSHKDAENPQTYINEGAPKSVANAFANKIKNYHQRKKMLIPLDQVGGCQENVTPNGFVSPIEMIMTQMGDCDTRTITLYLLLKSFGFDVIELVSDVESHAIIAINLPIAGGKVYYPFRGKKYYIWETTSKHYPGTHPDGVRYMKNWKNWKVELS